MYIKSTNEFISSPSHVWESLENHLGVEYANEVKSILDNNYTTEDEVNKLEKIHQEEIDSYISSISEKDNALSDIERLCDELIDTVQETPRLSRKKLVELLEDIKYTASNNY